MPFKRNGWIDLNGQLLKENILTMEDFDYEPSGLTEGILSSTGISITNWIKCWN